MLTLLNLATLGACFTLAAFLDRLRHHDPRGMQLMALLFVAMCAMMLGQLYPGAELVFGVVCLLAAVAYAVPLLFNVRSLIDWRPHRRDEPD